MGLIGVVGKLTAVAIVGVAVAIALIPSLLYTALPPDLSLDLTQPTTMIVTGANSGLGLATVQNFAHNEQATIVMACRNMAKCQTAKQQIHDNLGTDVVKADLRPMTLDLSSKESVHTFVKELQGQPIDILINNAGLAGSTHDLTYHEEDGVETHIRVNHLGPVYLTHCLWNNLLAAPHARVVMVSSVMAASAASSPTFGWYKGEERFASSWNIRMYGCSKRANLMFAQELHSRYKDSTTVSVTAAHPGWTHTDLCKNGCQGKNTAAKRLANLDALTGITKMPAEVGSLSQAFAAVLPQAGVYLGPSLLMVGDPKILGTLDQSWHHAAFTREESKHLWDKSMQALGIQIFGDYEIPVERIKEEEEEDEKAMADEPGEEEDDEEDERDEREEDYDDEDSSDDDEEEKIWNTYLGDGDYKEAVMM